MPEKRGYVYITGSTSGSAGQNGNTMLVHQVIDDNGDENVTAYFQPTGQNNWNFIETKTNLQTTDAKGKWYTFSNGAISLEENLVIPTSHTHDIITAVYKLSSETQKQTAKVSFVDDDENQAEISGYSQLTANGDSGSAISFTNTSGQNLTQIVDEIIGKNYVYAGTTGTGVTGGDTTKFSDVTLPSFDSDSSTEQDFTIHFKHATQNFNNNKTVTRTINYLEEGTNTQLADPDTETVTFFENGTHDLVDSSKDNISWSYQVGDNTPVSGSTYTFAPTNEKQRITTSDGKTYNWVYTTQDNGGNGAVEEHLVDATKNPQNLTIDVYYTLHQESADYESVSLTRTVQRNIDYVENINKLPDTDPNFKPNDSTNFPDFSSHLTNPVKTQTIILTGKGYINKTTGQLVQVRTNSDGQLIDSDKNVTTNLADAVIKNSAGSDEQGHLTWTASSQQFDGFDNPAADHFTSETGTMDNSGKFSPADPKTKVPTEALANVHTNSSSIVLNGKTISNPTVQNLIDYLNNQFSSINYWATDEIEDAADYPSRVDPRLPQLNSDFAVDDGRFYIFDQYDLQKATNEGYETTDRFTFAVDRKNPTSGVYIYVTTPNYSRFENYYFVDSNQTGQVYWFGRNQSQPIVTVFNYDNSISIRVPGANDSDNINSDYSLKHVFGYGASGSDESTDIAWGDYKPKVIKQTISFVYPDDQGKTQKMPDSPTITISGLTGQNFNISNIKDVDLGDYHFDHAELDNGQTFSLYDGSISGTLADYQKGNEYVLRYNDAGTLLTNGNVITEHFKMIDSQGTMLTWGFVNNTPMTFDGGQTQVKIPAYKSHDVISPYSYTVANPYMPSTSNIQLVYDKNPNSKIIPDPTYVVYTPVEEKGSVTVNVHDDTDNVYLHNTGYDLTTGQKDAGTAVSYPLSDVENDLTKRGYQIVGNLPTIPDKIVAKQNPTITIHVTHKFRQVTPNNPVDSTHPIDPDNPTNPVNNDPTPGLTKDDLQKTVKRTINYIFTDKTTAASHNINQAPQSVSFEGTAYIDETNGKLITFDSATNTVTDWTKGSIKWTPANGDLTAIDKKDVAGYDVVSSISSDDNNSVAKQDGSVSDISISKDTPDITVTIVYAKTPAPTPDKAQVEIIDEDESNKVLTTLKNNNGSKNETISFDGQDQDQTLQSYLNAGYVFDKAVNAGTNDQDTNDLVTAKNGNTITVTYPQFDGTPNNVQYFKIYLKHGTTTQTENDTTIAYVHYVVLGNDSDKPAAPADSTKQTINWTKTDTIDKVTDKVTNPGTWTADKTSFSGVTSPTVADYTPSQANVSFNLPVQGQDQVVTVYYTKNPAKALNADLKIYDKTDSNSLLNTFNDVGTNGNAISFTSSTAYLKSLIDRGYIIDSFVNDNSKISSATKDNNKYYDSTDSNSIIKYDNFDQSKGGSQHFILYLIHSTSPVDPDHPGAGYSKSDLQGTVTRTVNYVDQDGNSLGVDPVTETVTFKGQGIVDNVTGKLVTTNDSGQVTDWNQGTIKWTHTAGNKTVVGDSYEFKALGHKPTITYDGSEYDFNHVDQKAYDDQTAKGKGAIKSYTVTHASPSLTINVVYSKKPSAPVTQKAEVFYRDLDNNDNVLAHDDSSTDSNLQGTAGQVINYDSTDKINTLESKGYVLVNNGFAKGTAFDDTADGATAPSQIFYIDFRHGARTVDHDHPADPNKPVDPNHSDNTTTPKNQNLSAKDLQKIVTRTINYVIDNTDKTALRTPVTQTVTFNGEGTIDLVTGNLVTLKDDGTIKDQNGQLKWTYITSSGKTGTGENATFDVTEAAPSFTNDGKTYTFEKVDPDSVSGDDGAVKSQKVSDQDQDKVVTVYYKAIQTTYHTINSETRTVMRTINYYDQVTNDKIPSNLINTNPVTQTATVTRAQVVDDQGQVIGYGTVDLSDNTKYTLTTANDGWTINGNWAEVKSPDLSGYGYTAPTISIVLANTVDDKTTDTVVNVYYDHQHELITPNNPKNPTDPINNPNGPKYPAGLTKDDLQQTVTRTINYVGRNDDGTETPVKGAISGVDGITVNADGTSASESVTFERHAVVDKVTGEIIGYDTNTTDDSADPQETTKDATRAWIPQSGTFKEVNSQEAANVKDKDGKAFDQVSQETVPGIAVYPGQTISPVKVIYSHKPTNPAAQNISATVAYIDDTEKKTLKTDTSTDDPSLKGKAGDVIGYNAQTQIDNYIAHGYALVSSNFADGHTVFDADPTKNNFEIHLIHTIRPVNPDNPADPNSPVDPHKPNTPKPTDKSLTKADLQKTITRTINYVDEQGHQIADPVTDTVTYVGKGTIDEVTGNLVNLKDDGSIENQNGHLTWTYSTNRGASGEGQKYPIPATASRKQILYDGAVYNFDHVDKKDYDAGNGAVKEYPTDETDSADLVVKVIYKKEAQKAHLTIFDDTSNLVLNNNISASGDDGSAINFDNAANIVKTYTDGNYKFVSVVNDADPNSPLSTTSYEDGAAKFGNFDTNVNTDQNFTVHLVHKTKPVNPTNNPNGFDGIQLTKKVTRTITYVVPDGFTAPAAHTDEADFEGSGNVDLVTGKLVDIDPVTNAINDENGQLTWKLVKLNNVASSSGQDSADFGAITNPTVEGAHVISVTPTADGNITEVHANNGLNHLSQDFNIVVVYAKNAPAEDQLADLTFYDQDDKLSDGTYKQLGKLSASGKANNNINFTGADDVLNALTSGNYSIKDIIGDNSKSVGINYDNAASKWKYDNISDNTQHFIVYLAHKIDHLNPTNSYGKTGLTKTVTETVHYVDAQGHALATDAKQHETYSATALLDKATGKLIEIGADGKTVRGIDGNYVEADLNSTNVNDSNYFNWGNSADFNIVTSPNITGYHVISVKSDSDNSDASDPTNKDNVKAYPNVDHTANDWSVTVTYAADPTYKHTATLTIYTNGQEAETISTSGPENGQITFAGGDAIVTSYINNGYKLDHAQDVTDSNHPVSLTGKNYSDLNFGNYDNADKDTNQSFEIYLTKANVEKANLQIWDISNKDASGKAAVIGKFDDSGADNTAINFDGTQTTIDALVKSGYKVVEIDSDGAKATTTDYGIEAKNWKFDNKPGIGQNFVVQVEHTYDPINPNNSYGRTDLTRQVKETVHYVDEAANKPVASDYTHTLTFTGQGMVDKVTGKLLVFAKDAQGNYIKDSKGDYTFAQDANGNIEEKALSDATDADFLWQNPTTFAKVTSPTIAGYTIDADKTDQSDLADGNDIKEIPNVGYDHSPIEVTVYYKANPIHTNEAATLTIVDDTTGSQLANYAETGQDGDAISFKDSQGNSANDQITNYLSNGYDWEKSSASGLTVTSYNNFDYGKLDNDPKTNQSWTIYLVHKTKHLTSTDKYGNENLDKKIQRTVKYQYDDGTQAADSVTQTVEFNGQGYIDQVTRQLVQDDGHGHVLKNADGSIAPGQITWKLVNEGGKAVTDGNDSAAFKAINKPTVDQNASIVKITASGDAPYQVNNDGSVDAQNLTHNDSDSNVLIVYHKGATVEHHTAELIIYANDKQVGQATATGDKGTDISFANAGSIVQAFEDNGFTFDHAEDVTKSDAPKQIADKNTAYANIPFGKYSTTDNSDQKFKIYLTKASVENSGLKIVDDTENRTLANYSQSGKTGEPIKFADGITQLKYYLDNGYDWHGADENGTTLTNLTRDNYPTYDFGKYQDNENPVWTIHLVHQIIPVNHKNPGNGYSSDQLQKTVTTDVSYVDQDGKSIGIDPVHNSAIFNGSGYYDAVTKKWTDKDGKVLDDQSKGITWTNTSTMPNGNTVTFAKIDAEHPTGYTYAGVTFNGDPGLKINQQDGSIDAQTVTPTSADSNIVVHFNKNVAKQGTIEVIYHDNTSDVDLTGYGQTTTKKDQGTSFTYDPNAKDLPALEKLHYVIDGQLPTMPTKYTDGDQRIVIYVKHGTKNENVSQQVTRDFTYVFNDGTNAADHTTTDGQPVSEAAQTITFKGQKIIDLVTGKTVSVDKNGKITGLGGPVWDESSAELPTVLAKAVKGYHVVSTRNAHVDGGVGEVTVTPNSNDIHVRITYAPDEHNAETVVGKQTVHYVDGDNNNAKLADDNVNSTFTFTKDGKTGQWNEKSHKYDDANAPVIDGYVAEHKTYTGQTATPTDPNKEITIIYHKISDIIPVDKNGKQIPNQPTPTYVNDPHDPTKVVPNEPTPNIPGWHITKNPNPGQTPDGKTDDHTVTPIDPTKPTKVIYEQNGTTIRGKQSITANQKVEYQNDQGHTLSPEQDQSFTFTYSGDTYDAVTGDLIKKGTWNVDSYNFASEAVPNIPGYTLVSGYAKNGNSYVAGGFTTDPNASDSDRNRTFIVVYTKTPAKPVTTTGSITYYDDTDNQTLESTSFNGNVGEKINYATAGRLSYYEGRGYDLVRNDFKDGQQVFDKDASKNVFAVHLKHATVPITPQNPGKPGDPVPKDPNNPNEPDHKYPTNYQPQALTKDVTRTISYVFTDGKKNLPAVKKTIEFTGTGTLDLVTGHLVTVNKDGSIDQNGSIKWDTDSNQFAEVPAIDITGYYISNVQKTNSQATVDTKTGAVTGEKVTPTSNNIDIVITLTPKPVNPPSKNVQQANLTIIDDTEHNTLAQYSNSGEAGNSISFDGSTAALANYLNNGYVWEKADKNGATLSDLTEKSYKNYSFGKFTNDKTPQGWTIYLVHGTETITPDKPDPDRGYTKDSLTRTGTQTVHYIITGDDANKPAAPVDHVANVKFTHSLTIDKVTGKVIKDDGWTPTSQTYAQVDTPTIAGYEPDKKSIAVKTVTIDQKTGQGSIDDYEVVVYTKTPKAPDQATGTIVYIDDTAKKTLTTDNLSGQVGNKINYTTADKIQNYESQGYQLVSNNFRDGNEVFAKTGNNFAVHLVHTFIPINPGTKDKHGVNPDTLEKTVTETVHYVGAGDQTPKDNVQTSKWSKQVTYDEVTGKVVTNGQYDTDWSIEPGQKTVYDQVDTPTVPGYHADQDNVPATEVTQNNITKTVTYTKNPAAQAQIIIVYHDDTTNTDLKTDTEQPQDVGSQITYSTHPSISNYEKQGYKLAKDVTLPQSMPQNGFTGVVHLVHTYSPVDPEHLHKGIDPSQYEKDVTSTIHYVYSDGTKAHDDNVQRATWTRTITIDNVTGQIVPNGADDKPWTVNKKTYDQVTSPAIDGYHPDKLVVPAKTVTQDNLEETVIYVENGTTLKNQRSETASQTVEYQDDQGQTLSPTKTQSFTFTYSGDTYDAVTNKLLSKGKWLVASHSFTAEIVPVINGYVAVSGFVKNGAGYNAGGFSTDPDASDAQRNRSFVVIYKKIADIVPVTPDHQPIPDPEKPGSNVPNKPYVNDPKDPTKVTNEQVPTIPGYTPTISTVTPSDPTKPTEVTYTKNPVTDTGTVTITVHDNTTGQDLTQYGYTSDKNGQPQKVGTNIVYNKTQTITDLINHGYKVINPDISIPSTVTKGSTPVVIYVEHTTTTVTPDKPGTPGQPIDPTNPNGPKYPDGTDINQLKKTGTQTIHYTGAGNRTPADNTQSFTFTRQITFDNVTGKIVNTTPWNEASHTFGDVRTPVVNGYHADQIIAGGSTVTPDDLSKTVTVTYNGNGRIIPVGPDGKPIPGADEPVLPTDPKDPTKVDNGKVPVVPGYEPVNGKPGDPVAPNAGDPSQDVKVPYQQNSPQPSEPDRPIEPITPQQPTSAPTQPTTAPSQPTKASQPTTAPTTPTQPEPDEPDEPDTPDEPAPPTNHHRTSHPATNKSPRPQGYNYNNMPHGENGYSYNNKPIGETLPNGDRVLPNGEVVDANGNVVGYMDASGHIHYNVSNGSALPQTGENNAEDITEAIAGGLAVSIGLIGLAGVRRKRRD